MGKFVYIHSNEIKIKEDTIKKIEHCLSIRNVSPYICRSENQLLWVNNPCGISIDKFSLVTGNLYGDSIESSAFFSFKLITNENEVILNSDLVASRTVWYFKSENYLIISSSQRVIISLLGDFEINHQAISWMFTTGCLGPFNAWDKRINSIQPGCKIIFNKQNHTAAIEADHNLNENANSTIELESVFNQVFSKIEKNKKYVITLSGGLDSRIVAHHLSKNKIPVQAYTWGKFKNTINEKGNDAYLAKRIAKHYNIPFYYRTLFSEENDFEKYAMEFIRHSEGRIDHINAFTDGLKFWKELSDSGQCYVIRADEAFGWIKAKSEKDVRISLDMNLPGDYSNLLDLLKISNIQTPEVPTEFQKKDFESISAWRDRLYRNFRIPYILSSLHDLMLPFVEIYNPLLHSSFIDWSINLDDKGRDGKAKYTKYVNSVVNFDTASKPSIDEPEAYILNEKAKSSITNSLMSDESIRLFGEEFIRLMLNEFTIGEGQKPVRYKVLSNFVPFWFKKLIRNTIAPYKLSHHRLILRVYIVVKTIELFRQDLKITTDEYDQ